MAHIRPKEHRMRFSSKKKVLKAGSISSVADYHVGNKPF